MQAPKGFLLSIGGAEDKGDRKKDEVKEENDFLENGILNEVVRLLKSTKGKVEVITTATSYPNESYQNYKKAFSKLGCSYVGHLPISDRSEANLNEYLSRLEKCDGVMFTGGDQQKISAILGGSELCRKMKQRYFNQHFVIAGTSAGAAAMSTVMMNGGDEEKAFLKGQIELSAGFGFINDVIIDTHFDARGRFERLAHAVAVQPALLGVGLGEDTGVIIEKGTFLRCVGSGCVTIIDGREITHNNIAFAEEGSPLSIAKFGVCFMSKSDCFDIEKRKFLPAPIEKSKE